MQIHAATLTVHMSMAHFYWHAHVTGSENQEPAEPVLITSGFVPLEYDQVSHLTTADCLRLIADELERGDALRAARS